jgi:HPt (histidine-containing phosphotransfer) domain-containing protein
MPEFLYKTTVVCGPGLTSGADGGYLWVANADAGQLQMPVNDTTLASPVFDQLQQAMACDPAGFTELYRDYLEDAWEAVRKLRDALRQQQPEEIRAHAHRLKGSSMVLGAQVVAQCASALENMAHSGDVQPGDALLERTGQAMADVQAELARRLGAEVIPAGKTAA